jgi:hypothetical protein
MQKTYREAEVFNPDTKEYMYTERYYEYIGGYKEYLSRVHINKETGESVDLGLPQNTKEIMRENIEPDTMFSFGYKTENDHVKLFTELEPDIQTSFKGYYTRLIRLVPYGHTCLVRVNKKDRKYIPYTHKELYEFLGVSKNTFTTFISQAVTAKAIARVSIAGQQGFALNPVYGLKGRQIDLMTYMMFHHCDLFMKYVPEGLKTYLDYLNEKNDKFSNENGILTIEDLKFKINKTKKVKRKKND